MADRDDIPAVLSILVLGAGFAALFLGYSWFWAVWVFGFVVLVPLAAILLGDDEEERGRDRGDDAERRADSQERPESKQDALDLLRERYARGEMTDEQFERKVERLLETETPEAAEAAVSERRAADDGAASASDDTETTERTGDAEHERESDRR